MCLIRAHEILVRVHKVRLAVLNGISSLRSIEHAAVLLPREQEIKDIKYVDDQIMIVALAKKCKCAVKRRMVFHRD